MALGDITSGPVTYAAGTNTHRPPAPALSPEEARTVARFDAAPVPPEVVVETVARALWEALPDSGYGRKPWADLSKTTHFLYRRLAAAAIAALPPSPAEQAVKRVEGVLERQYREAWAAWEATLPTVAGVPASTESRIAWARVNQALSDQEALAAALASPAPAPQGEEGQR